jgi:hypothetical protein
MNIHSKIGILIAAALLTCLYLLAGCGSSGGGGAVVSTSIKGTAAKGIIYPGTVVIYAIDNNGQKATTPLATVATDVNGRYNADLGSYSGGLLLEAYGTYTDEATGSSVAITPFLPLHAVVDAVNNSTNNNRPIAVTPLTELAYRLAGSNLSAANIAAVNKRVSDLFKIDDIIATLPVKADTASLSAATTAQQTYSLLLATISQMAKERSAGEPASFSQIDTLLVSFNADLALSATAGLGSSNQALFSTALTVATSSQTFSGLTTAAATLISVGSPVFKLTLNVAAVPTGVTLGGIKATITLPSAVSLYVDGSGMVTDNQIFTIAATGSGTTLMTGNYQSSKQTLTISLVNSGGIVTGDCAYVVFAVAAGKSVKLADFSVALDDAKDAGPTYAAVSGVKLALK